MDILDGKRPEGAGFSFLPELVVFPAAFVIAAMVIDYFAMPYGRWLIAGISAAMVVLDLGVISRCYYRLRRIQP